jgi:hypothetical protein
MQLYPEIDMVLHSKCYSPILHWDGKLFNWQIWTNYVGNRDKIYNLHNAKDFPDIVIEPPPSISSHSHLIYNLSTSATSSASSLSFDPTFSFLRGNAGTSSKSSSATSSSRSSQLKPLLVLFGTHHKTGTFLAKKIFSKLCSKYSFCCQFQVTRDSLHSMYSTLNDEIVDILGHNQWIWYPYELNLTNHQNSYEDYRFIHFYRHPFQKIISSYYYHLAGVEAWTQKPLSFYRICPKIEEMFSHSNAVTIDQKTGSLSPERSDAEVKKCTRNLLYSPMDSTSSHDKEDRCLYEDHPLINREESFDYCNSIHLCQTCCRKEHESTFSFHPYSSFPTSSSSLKGDQTHSLSSPPFKHQYRLRPLEEYQFVCQFLGSKIPYNQTLQQTLLSMSLMDGLLLESALNYYEILRMAKIVNYTSYDSIHNLNMNLDSLTTDYDENVETLLYHIEKIFPFSSSSGSSSSSSVVTTSLEIATLQKELSFYNLEDSFWYRWSMSNPLNNHVTNTKNEVRRTTVAPARSNNPSSAKPKSSRKEAFNILATNPIVQKMYAPIFSLMSGVLKESK